MMIEKKSIVIIDIGTRKVEYFPNEKSYLKTFKPKLKDKFKFWFRIRRYPGENFKYISEELTKIGVNSVKVKTFGKYFVDTEEIDGTTLENFLLCCSDDEKHKIILQFIDYVIRIINAGIYFGDFHYKNFMVDKNQMLIAIDLEGYKKEKINSSGPTASMRRLKKDIKDKEVYLKIESRIKIKDKFYQKK
ncbi:MAG: hypothetical protein ACRC0Y_06335 [Fusobacteriaceae bacterium]